MKVPAIEVEILDYFDDSDSEPPKMKSRKRNCVGGSSAHRHSLLLVGLEFSLGPFHIHLLWSPSKSSGSRPRVPLNQGPPTFLVQLKNDLYRLIIQFLALTGGLFIYGIVITSFSIDTYFMKRPTRVENYFSAFIYLYN